MSGGDVERAKLAELTREVNRAIDSGISIEINSGERGLWGRAASADPQPGEREAGSTTVFWAILFAGLGLLAASVAFAINVWTVRTQTQAAVDLAALSAATRSVEGAWEATDQVRAETTERACTVATQVAEAQDVQVTQCWTSGADVYVVAAKPAAVGPWQVTVQAKARAGVDVD